MARAHPEDDLQRAIVQYLGLIERRAGIWWCHVPNGGKRFRVEAAIMKGLGVKAGVPDILIIWRGEAYWLELKASKGRLSDAQREMHATLGDNDAPVAVCRSLDEVTAALTNWGMLK